LELGKLYVDNDMKDMFDPLPENRVAKKDADKLKNYRSLKKNDVHMWVIKTFTLKEQADD
jgi:hypothetical protein